MRFEGYLNENLKSDYLDVIDGKSSLNCDVTIVDFSKFKSNYQEYQKRIQNENTTFNSLVSDINASRLRKEAEEKRRYEERMAKEKFEKEHANELYIMRIQKKEQKLEIRFKIIREVLILLAIVSVVIYFAYGYIHKDFVDHFGKTKFILITIIAAVITAWLGYYSTVHNKKYKRKYNPNNIKRPTIENRAKANLFAFLSLCLICAMIGTFIITKISVDNLPYTIFDERAAALLSKDDKLDYDVNETTIVELYESYMSFTDSGKKRLKVGNEFKEYIYEYNTYKVNLVDNNLISLNISNSEELLIKSIKGFDSLIYEQRDMITNEMILKYNYYLEPYNQVIFIDDVYDNIWDKYEKSDEVKKAYSLLSDEKKRYVYNSDLINDFDLAFESIDSLVFNLEKDGTYSVSAKNNFTATSLIIPKKYKNIDVTRLSSLKYCSSLTKLVIPSTIKGIYSGALNGCSNLKTLELPFVGTSETATEMYRNFGAIFGEDIYSGGILTEQYYYYYYPNYSVGHYTKWVIPKSLEEVIITSSSTIALGAFQNCKYLKKIVIENTIKNIGRNAFSGISSSTIICFRGIAQEWGSIIKGSGNEILNSLKIYYYTYYKSEETKTGYWWYYENREIFLIVND